MPCFRSKHLSRNGGVVRFESWKWRKCSYLAFHHFIAGELMASCIGVSWGRWQVCSLFYVLATSKIISGQVPTGDSAYPWWLYSDALVGDQLSHQHHELTHDPDTEPPSPCPMLITPSTWLGRDKYEFGRSLIWFDCSSNPWGLNPLTFQNGKWDIQLIRLPDLV